MTPEELTDVLNSRLRTIYAREVGLWYLQIKNGDDWTLIGKFDNIKEAHAAVKAIKSAFQQLMEYKS